MNSYLVEAFGFVAAAATLFIFFPQALVAWKNRTDPSAFAGLSTGTIWLSLVAAVGWLFYGAGIGAFWTMVPSFVNIPLTSLILFFVYRSRKNS